VAAQLVASRVALSPTELLRGDIKTAATSALPLRSLTIPFSRGGIFSLFKGHRIHLLTWKEHVQISAKYHLQRRTATEFVPQLVQELKLIVSKYMGMGFRRKDVIDLSHAWIPLLK
jgi:hypothetical protein